MKDFIVKNNIKRFTRTEDLFKVEMEFICKRPNRPQNEYPRGDVDNFAKGPLDVLTHCECFWYDDVQITELNVVKRYAIGDEQYGIRIIISTI